MLIISFAFLSQFLIKGGRNTFAILISDYTSLCHRTTFTYVTYDDITLKLDYYKSIAKDKRPCVLVIHGGSWISGDSKQLPELNSELAWIRYNVAVIKQRYE
jgi:acetyl esterase/lipase